jgi:hypothetical protein
LAALASLEVRKDVLLIQHRVCVLLSERPTRRAHADDVRTSVVVALSLMCNYISTAALAPKVFGTWQVVVPWAPNAS